MSKKTILKDATDINFNSQAAQQDFDRAEKQKKKLSAISKINPKKLPISIGPSRKGSGQKRMTALRNAKIK
ncbi:MAG TPA: hypothetical protein VG982_01585 [Candidatus Paceibacterota bacterium]|nr:hypothetical protein [Candidatus Paceibacterota bacterium]